MTANLTSLPLRSRVSDEAETAFTAPVIDGSLETG
jgi:hypothetical protein